MVDPRSNGGVTQQRIVRFLIEYIFSFGLRARERDNTNKISAPQRKIQIVEIFS